MLRREVGEGKDLPKLTSDVKETLERYAWPGNVRELENALKHATTFAQDGLITPEVLPPRILSSVKLDPAKPTSGDAAADPYRYKSLKAFIRDREKEYLGQVLNLTNGDK
jgi:DNA-binding NtrC family response regulator